MPISRDLPVAGDRFDHGRVKTDELKIINEDYSVMAFSRMTLLSKNKKAKMEKGKAERK